jgi:hypothetical protein
MGVCAFSALLLWVSRLFSAFNCMGVFAFIVGVSAFSSVGVLAFLRGCLGFFSESGGRPQAGPYRKKDRRREGSYSIMRGYMVKICI